VKEACAVPSHPKSALSLADFLKTHQTPAMEGADTRALTIKIRSKGTMKAALVPVTEDLGTVAREVRSAPHPDTRNLVAEVSCRDVERFPGVGTRTIVVVDCGVKRNIIREAQRYANVVRVPFDTAADAIMALQPDGVILSNGPGDPAHPEVVATSVRTARELAGHVPLLGICLGHQLLSLAFGGKTFKLKFGHRGGNQPVKDLRTGRVHITSQNHGFAVDADSLPSEFEVTHVNLNDRTVEGMAHRELPIFSVQYHPEAADAVYVEPLTVPFIEKVIAKERPQGILSGMGGQTALNLCSELSEAGVLSRHGVELLGTKIEAITAGEDRQRFADLMRSIGEPIPRSRAVSDNAAAAVFVEETGYPVIVRAAYTLGGSGSGIAHTAEELERIVGLGIAYSRIKQVLVEESVLGWKEFEYEVMRD